MRSDAAQAQGDFLNLQASSALSSKGCGRPTKGTIPSSPPSTLITSTEACEATGAVGVVNIAVACLGQAALDLENCDPNLGFEVSPTTIQTLQPDGTYSAADLNTVLVCNRAPGAAPVVVTQADFRALQLTPSPIVVGPAQGWVPVNMITIVYTDAQPQVITTTLLGQPVTVRATPRDFVWDWADGSTPTATTDAGAPWPDHTVAYAYARTGDYTVTMTTTWTGEYSLDGGVTYTPITGTASTVSTAPPLTVKELRSHLVEDPIS
ncbi:hypothetical protein [Sanguibacter gelidistatuariae]|uniref:hypothetical protein n=1 Tax=Sanguibacter gelidistatuariae TaxID=1814289 RepID=UPI001113C1A4|nr:hypothetical protein [Sanguibacter gelidistatuariae]